MASIFPQLPGIKAERTISAEFATQVHRSASGRRSAMGERLFPVWRFALRYEFLRAKPTALELQALRGFFLARRGALEPFYLRDPDRCQVVAQPVGVGAAGVLSYPLVYAEGGAVDRVGAVDTTGAAPVALVNGAQVPATFTRNRLQLASAAPVGATVAWTGSYFFHVAFADDRLDFKRFLHLLYSVDGVELESVNQHD